MSDTQEPEQLTYSQLVRSVLEYIKDGDKDNEMVARAALKHEFRISDTQIDTELLKEHSESKIVKVEQVHDSVDLVKVKQLDYLMEDWIVKGDVCLTYGPYGTGKTTLLLWKAYNYALGKNILDRDKKCEPGRSLFIATDSGSGPLKKAMLDLELDPSDPIFTPGHKEQMIWTKAYEPEQGHKKWVCNINGVIELEDLIKKHNITYVCIDSVKSVSSGYWSYTNNEAVKAMLGYLIEIICKPNGVCIDFISHDGSEKGSYSGAKAWGEEPSMVVSLTNTGDENGGEKGVTAEFKKNRAALIDHRRKLTYSLEDGELKLQEGTEIVGNCTEAICDVLWRATLNKRVPLSTQGIKHEVFETHNRSGKTVENSLRSALNSRKIIKARKGFYELSPSEKQRKQSSTTVSLTPNRGVGELGGGYRRSIAGASVRPTPDQPPSGVRNPQPKHIGGTSGVKLIPVGDYLLGQPSPDQGIPPQNLLPYQMEDDDDIEPHW